MSLIVPMVKGFTRGRSRYSTYCSNSIWANVGNIGMMRTLRSHLRSLKPPYISAPGSIAIFYDFCFVMDTEEQ